VLFAVTANTAGTEAVTLSERISFKLLVLLFCYCCRLQSTNTDLLTRHNLSPILKYNHETGAGGFGTPRGCAVGSAAGGLLMTFFKV
jgi:hypothetical protein